MTELARLTGEFAAFLTPAQANDDKLTQWIVTVRTAGLPHLCSFCNGLELDRATVNAGLTLPHHNGRTEGVNTRTKKIMRQMHGRAGFDLLPTTEQSHSIDVPRSLHGGEPALMEARVCAQRTPTGTLPNAWRSWRVSHGATRLALPAPTAAARMLLRRRDAARVGLAWP